MPRNRTGGAVQRAAPQPIGRTGEFFRATYGWSFLWFGLGAFFAAGSLIYDHVISPSDLPMIPIPGHMVWSAALIGTVVGIYSLWHGLMGSPALILDEDGITGFNLYGRSHIAWDDIDYLTHQNSKEHGRTLKIKSKKRWLGVIPREVIYSPKHADKTEEEVVAAIRAVRPDL